MKRVFSHIKRLFRKFWFFMFLAFAISPIIGLGILIVATVLSMALFSDPIDAKDPTDYFTEDELRKLQSGEVEDDEEFLALLAKYQTFECPVKIDNITTWTSSQLTKEAFILNYEINDRRNRYVIDMNVAKSKALAQLNIDNDNVKHLVATNRRIIHRYWNRQTGTTEDVVISTDELRN